MAVELEDQDFLKNLHIKDGSSKLKGNFLSVDINDSPNTS